MELQNLLAFKTVAELQSFSLAAEKLFLTQPAVSKRIHVLEEQLGTRLFDRIGKKIMLTEAGESLLPRCRQMLQLERDIRQTIADLGATVSGELRLVTSHHIGLHRLPAVLKKFKRKYPEVALNIQFKNSMETYRAILEGGGDLGITTEEEIEEEHILAADVWRDDLRFMVARHHPLAKKRTVTLDEIAAYKAVLPDPQFHTTRLVERLFETRGLALQKEPDLATNYLETIKALISIGDTWSVLPETMADKKLSVLKPRGVHLSRQLVCIRHRDRTLSRAGRAFLKILGD